MATQKVAIGGALALVVVAAVVGTTQIAFENANEVTGIPKQTEPSLDTRVEIAARFAPVLELDSHELFVPIDRDAYISATELHSQKGKLASLLNAAPTPVSLPSSEGECVRSHPVGGCPMGRSPERGVVDEHGQVFGYPGLSVADGSVLPGPAGPNRSLTIAAVADRSAEWCSPTGAGCTFQIHRLRLGDQQGEEFGRSREGLGSSDGNHLSGQRIRHPDRRLPFQACGLGSLSGTA